MKKGLIVAGVAGVIVAGVLVLRDGATSAAPAVEELPPEAREVTVYKSPTCGCCTLWADHMREAGFEVREIDRTEMIPVKKELGVPLELASCHTAIVDGYVLEGHVPAGDVARLLSERPSVGGLAVPGMPMGSPGMEGPRKDDYRVITFGGEGGQRVWAEH